MKHVLFAFGVLLFCSCTTSRPVQLQVAEHIRHDTVYLSNIRYDSIYVDRSCETDRTRDTVTITKTRNEYRYRLLRDTVRIVERDSIPYEVTVYRDPVTHNPSTINCLKAWFGHICQAAFFILLASLLLYRSFSHRNKESVSV